MTNGLVIMIIVAAYTANLAAFLTIKPEPSVSFGSSGWLSMVRARVRVRVRVRPGQPYP